MILTFVSSFTKSKKNQTGKRNTGSFYIHDILLLREQNKCTVNLLLSI